jgi:hypothetical protein
LQWERQIGQQKCKKKTGTKTKKPQNREKKTTQSPAQIRICSTAFVQKSSNRAEIKFIK